MTKDLPVSDQAPSRVDKFLARRNQEAGGSWESDLRARRHRQPGGDLGRGCASAGADVLRSFHPRLARHAAGLFSRHRARRCGMQGVGLDDQSDAARRSS